MTILVIQPCCRVFLIVHLGGETGLVVAAVEGGVQIEDGVAVACRG
jgi:hypothetical protein